MSEYVSKSEFAAHAANEEANQRITNDALHEGNIRMGNIESNISELTSDLKPLKAIYNAVVGASALGTIAIGLLIYIYHTDQSRVVEDRQHMKIVADAVIKHGTAIEKILQSHEELEKDTTREFQRIEKVLERKVGLGG